MNAVVARIVVVVLVAGCVAPPPKWGLDLPTIATEDTSGGDGDLGQDAQNQPDGALPEDTAGKQDAAPDLAGETAGPCVPDCTDKACGLPDGCGGICYDEASCDDGVHCTVDLCVATEDGGCQHIEDHASCDDGNVCTVNTCNAETGCQQEHVEMACDDDNLCTVNDTCQQGQCVGELLDAQVSCDDGNSCTEDTCLAESGCVAVPLDGPCLLGDLVQGECIESVCVPEALTQVPCTGPDDCALLDNDDLCDGHFVCGESGKCQFDAASITTCDGAGDTVCLKNKCDPESGQCEMTAAGEGLPCDDEDACTLGDACEAGACVPGAGQVVCNDHNPCTEDVCLPEQGCSFTAVGLSCDDGDPCTVADQCVEGLCLGTLHVCNDGLGCTVEECDGMGGCQDPILQDGWCIIEQECVATGETDPDNVCRHCNPEQAVDGFSEVEFGALCTKPNAEGKCIGGICKDIECLQGYLSCDDTMENGCEVDGDHDPSNCGECQKACIDGETCVDSECLSTCPGNGLPPCAGECPDYDSDPENCSECGKVCESESLTEVGVCLDGICDVVQCDPGAWNVDGKPGNGCEYDCSGEQAEEVCDGEDNDCDGFIDEGSCDDGLDCTIDVCNAQLGCKHTPADVLCDDGNECTQDTCSAQTGCVSDNLEGNCDDGDPCTEGDQCQGAACTGQPVAGCCHFDEECDDSNVCTMDLCNQQTHQCQHPSGVLELSLCDLDQDGCTRDRCISGVCTAGAAVDCGPSPDGCQANGCVSLGPIDWDCVTAQVPAGTPCDDGLFCTVNETCSDSGQCSGGGELDCAGLVGPCQTASCDEEQDQCVAADVEDGLLCDADGDGCTAGDSCKGGLCLPGPAPDCSDALPDCTVGVCASLAIDDYQCETATAPKGTSCEDGLSCTEDDWCDEQGVCNGGPEPPCNMAAPPCAQAVCDEGAGGCTLVALPDGAACDDGNACTLEDTCQSAQCVAGADACVERKLNGVTKMVLHGPEHELEQTAHLGFGRTVTVWRAGDGDVRAQMLDKEGTKLVPELELTSDSWPPMPANCGRAVTRPSLTARADGNWLVAVPYVWREMYYTGCGGAWYQRLCNFKSHYALAFSVRDRHGSPVKDWTYLLPDVQLSYSNSYNWGCNCTCASSYGGAGLPPIDQLAFDWLSTVAFSDGSFGVLVSYTIQGGAQSVRYVPITSTLEIGAWQNLPNVQGPTMCRLTDDRIVLAYDDGAGTGKVRLYDKKGVALAEAVDVSAEQVGFQSRLACRAGADGAFTVAFNTYLAGGTSDVYVQRFGGEGQPLGATFKANQATDDVQYMTAGGLVYLADGALGTAWHDCPGGTDTCLAKARLFDESNAPRTSEFSLGEGDVLGFFGVLGSLPDGNWYSVWLKYLNSTDRDVLFRSFDAQGKPFAGAIERSAGYNAGNNERHGRAVPLSEGGFALVWDVEDGAGHSDVAMQTFFGSGQAGGDPVTVNQHLDGLHYNAATARTSSGNAVIAWTSFGQAEDEDVYARLLSGNGEFVSDEFRVNETAADGQYGPQLDYLSDGVFVAVWSGWGGVASGTDVFARVFDGNGQALTGDFALPQVPEGEQGNVAVTGVSGTSPGFVAAWSRAGAEAPAGVYVRKFDAAGAALTDDVLVDPGGLPEQVAIAGNGVGDVVVCWRAGASIFCRRLNDKAATLGERFLLEGEGNPVSPRLLFRDADRLWVLYSRDNGDAGGTAVYRRHVDLYGAQKGAVALLNWTEAGDQHSPFAAVLGTGNVIAGWTDAGQDGEADGIRFRILD